MDPDPTTLAVTDLAEAMRRRALRCSDVVDAYLARIEALDPIVRSYLVVDAPGGRARAEEADRALDAGVVWGPLHGVPVAVKDLIDAAGFPTTCGAAFFRDRVPNGDAAVVSRLRAAGAVVLGKVALHEFALGVTGVNPHFGSPRNPHDLARITGGSSSGSAAAVAAGLCAASVGSDTGGSIRIPAAFCGVVGLKPTHGQVSLRGVFPLAPSLDHVGPIARTVRDAALLLGVVAGHDPGDTWSRAGAPPPHLGGRAAGVRVGVLRGEYFEERLDPDVAAAFDASLALLRDVGCRLEDVTLPAIEEIQRVAVTVLYGEASAVHRRYAERRSEYGEDVRALLDEADRLPAGEYVAASWRRPELAAGVAALFDRVDVLAAPAEPIPAPRVADVSGEGWRSLRPVITRFVRIFNLTGLPAISVPCGATRDHLPIALQLAGRPFDESTLLAVAEAFERARGGPWAQPVSPPFRSSA